MAGKIYQLKRYLLIILDPLFSKSVDNFLTQMDTIDTQLPEHVNNLKDEQHRTQKVSLRLRVLEGNFLIAIANLYQQQKAFNVTVNFNVNDIQTEEVK